MEVKVEVKMDITPTFSFYPFTFLPFYLFTISDILKFLT